jgi:hypothetical protein
MRIKALDHSLDRALHQFLVILGLDIVFFNLAQHFRENFKVLVSLSGSRFDHDRISIEKENAPDQNTEHDGLQKKSLVVSRHSIAPDLQ